MIVFGNAVRNLVTHFGLNRLVTEITPGDAHDFGRYLASTKLSRATIDKRMQCACSMFDDALNHEHIEKNPFRGWRKKLKGLVGMVNNTRQRFISRDDFIKLVEHAPDAEWRLILALARFGGLRTRSEPLSLLWGDVDFEQDRLRIRCPKLEHHAGKAIREIPLFPELRPFLQDVWDQAEVGVEFVIAKHRPKCLNTDGSGWGNTNLRTQLQRIYKRAGLEMPPKAWNNMRASRATELAEQYPGHVAAQWLGHSEEIANRHYRQVTEEHFAKAIITERVMPKVMPLEAALSTHEAADENGHLPQVVTVQEKTAACDSMQPFSLDDTRLELVTSTMSTSSWIRNVEKRRAFVAFRRYLLPFRVTKGISERYLGANDKRGSDGAETGAHMAGWNRRARRAMAEEVSRQELLL